jgi:hypothetical protein
MQQFTWFASNYHCWMDQQCHIYRNLEMWMWVRGMRISKGDDTSPNFGICDTTRMVLSFYIFFYSYKEIEFFSINYLTRLIHHVLLSGIFLLSKYMHFTNIVCFPSMATLDIKTHCRKNNWNYFNNKCYD